MDSALELASAGNDSTDERNVDAPSNLTINLADVQLLSIPVAMIGPLSGADTR